MFTMCIYTVIGFLLILKLRGIYCETFCSGCDCTIRADRAQSKGVIYTKAVCTEGKLVWDSPSGSVRLDLNLGYSWDSQVCLIVESKQARVKVSQEGFRRRHVIFPDNDAALDPVFAGSGKSREYCLTASSRVPAILYIESEHLTNSSGFSQVTLRYSVEGIHTDITGSEPPVNECAPCTDKQILRAYCSSDFVVEGTMKKVQYNQHMDQTEIHVLASKVVLPKDKPLFYKPDPKSLDSLLEGVITASPKCRVKHGPGEFLFTGKVRLGRLIIGCAPYLDDWLTIYEKAAQLGGLDCTLH